MLVYERHMVVLAKQQWEEEQQRIREQEALAQAQRDEEERQAELARQAKQKKSNLFCALPNEEYEFIGRNLIPRLPAFLAIASCAQRFWRQSEGLPPNG